MENFREIPENDLKIGFLQTNPAFGDKEQNFAQVEHLIGGDLVDILVLPELFATGYTFISKDEVQEYAEDQTGKTTNFLQNIAKSIDGVVIGGYPERQGKNIYNSAMMVDEDGVIENYRKIHLFNKEKLWFTPGNNPYPVVKLKKKDNVKVGMMICFDWIYPEATRTLAMKGADIIAHPTNLVLPYCQNAMITRCISNRVFAITCNRVGEEKREGKFGRDEFLFTGQSQITDVDGEILAHAPKEMADFCIVDINFKKARNKNLNDYNHLFEDRNENLYYH